jgi:histidine ammonia-lyase
MTETLPPHPAASVVRPAAVALDVSPLRPEQVVAVARHDAPVALSPAVVTRIVASRDAVEVLAAGERPAYGVSTGFGALATRHIPADRRTQLQRSLIRSHAAGSGPEVEREVVRAMMLLRLRTLASGHTGVRPEVAHLLAAC